MALHFSYQSTIDDFDWDTANRETEKFCNQNAAGISKLFVFQLIIEELVTNIIKYGKKKGDEIIRIDAEICGESIDLTISDNTAMFNPLKAKSADTELSAEDRTIGGLGLVLVREKAKAIDYHYEKGLNIVNVKM